jgi:hypothetical protein
MEGVGLLYWVKPEDWLETGLPYPQTTPFPISFSLMYFDLLTPALQVSPASTPSISHFEHYL